MGIIFNAWHQKASAKTQVSLTRFLQSEVKIIHIIVQDQDGCFFHPIDYYIYKLILPSSLLLIILLKVGLEMIN